jgi:predicted nucleic acid-binding protein
MNVVDSSAWIEWLNGGPNAADFRGAIADVANLVVPSVVILEVLRLALRTLPEQEATELAQVLAYGRVVPLDEELAISAAHLGVTHRLALADSIVYATARRFDATIWTQDVDFEGLPGVEFRPKAKP